MKKLLLALLVMLTICPSAFAIKNPWMEVDNCDKKLAYAIADKVAIKHGFPEPKHGRMLQNLQIFMYADKNCIHDCTFTTLQIAKVPRKGKDGYQFGLYETTILPAYVSGVLLSASTQNRSDRPSNVPKLQAIMADFKAEWEAAKRSTPPQN